MTTTKTAVAAAAAVAAVLALGACSTGTEKAASSSTAASTSASASAQAHNHADVMFARHMIPHHQQAIEMSDMILAKKGIDPRVTELATQIKAAQGPEIEKMQGWLTEWGVPTEMPAMDMSGMDMPRTGQDPDDDGADHHGDMPGMPGESMMPTTSMMPRGSMMPGMGMMSQADMEALDKAQGVEADKLFLAQMITHHQGAIDMAGDEVKNGLYPAAVEMAKSIISGQQKEIDTMKDMLSSL